MPASQKRDIRPTPPPPSYRNGMLSEIHTPREIAPVRHDNLSPPWHKRDTPPPTSLAFLTTANWQL
jgi:hypothetical protein